MPKLRVLSGRQVRAILEANGFVFVSQKGSHIKLQHQLEDVTYTAIVPDHKEVALGTLGDIVKRSGLPRELFEA